MFHAANNSTMTNPIAEAECSRYGVRYTSTLLGLPVHYATLASFCSQTSIPKTPMPEGNKIWVSRAQVDSGSTRI